jgi:hypothetical protein
MRGGGYCSHRAFSRGIRATVMKRKILLALVALSLVWPMVSEAGWRNRWVCHTGTATGGGSSSTSTVCGWEPYWEHEGVPEDLGFGGAGGPGGSGSSSGTGTVLDAPNNPTPATCQSDALTRLAHAQEDGRYTRAQQYPRVPATGSLWRVTFDDGGSEIYSWTGMSSPFESAIPGSLQCP